MSLANTPTRFMQRALQLAARGRGYVQPNPMVGCVLVRDNRIVAEGFHQRYGQAHAEVMALRDAQTKGIDTTGLHAYVTLEPCCHFGKTPPCVQALIAAKVGHVSAAMVDPFPAVSGKGLQQLKQAGIRTSVGLCEAEARQLNAAFIKRCEQGLPWVMLKWAQTLDGYIATRNGHSQWVSGPQARRWVHQQRSWVDVIMTGIGTVLADDPQLTARGVKLRRVARRVVIDPSLKLPLHSRLVQSLRESESAAALTVAVHEQGLREPVGEWSDKLNTLRKLGVEVIGLPVWATGESTRTAAASLLDLRPLMKHLLEAHRAGNVWVEGGARLNGALLAQGLADQVLAIVAPKWLGDPQALHAMVLPAGSANAMENMDHAHRLTLQQLRRLGDDVLLDYRV